MAAKSSQQNKAYFEDINPYRIGDSALLSAFLDGHSIDFVFQNGCSGNLTTRSIDDLIHNYFSVGLIRLGHPYEVLPIIFTLLFRLPKQTR